jgi:hypothetical protein
MKAAKSKEKNNNLKSRKILKNPETIPRKSHPDLSVPKPRFLDSSRPDPDQSQNVHPAGL